MPNDDVIIVGSLSDKELRDSIDKLVDYVGDKTTIMAGKFDVAMEKMKSAMKDFAITQKVSVDLMQDAWKKMSTSFDAMLKAQQNATSSGNNSGAGGGSSQYQDNTVGHLQEIIALEEKRRKEMQLNSDELRQQNTLLEQQRKDLRSQTTSDRTKQAKNYKDQITIASHELERTLPQAEQKLRNLLRIKNELRSTPVLDSKDMARLDQSISKLIQRVRELRSKGTPKTMKEVLGMDESSVDAITRKMQALRRVTIDPNNATQVKQLGDEYQRLSKLQTSLLGKNAQVIRSNNYLAQSFGYIRNRIVYALTLGAITSFTKQVYEIRGQYELLERSLGVLVNSFEKGSQIFQELNEMAIKSPFTLIELGTAAKQLTAYNFAADEVVDTTRRLADISAALGVPMERLTYNLGQIKAQGVLNARDARDFANAGLAIVPMLAQMYTEQKRFGDQVVTTAQVYDMMSKKLVSYSDVLQVLYKITDEGGKFFDFQAKQADTLRVQLANLTLAYNNMLNEIGAEHQSTLSKPIHVIKELFQNWREVNRVLLTLITTFGVYKTVSMLAVGSQTISAWISLAKSIKSAKDAMALFNLTTSANPLGLLLSLLAAVVGYFVLFKNKVSEVSKEVEMFGESATKTLKKIDTFKKILEGTSETSSTYKKTLSELSSITDEYGVQLDKENAKRSDVNSAIEQTIELIKTESAERQRANQLAKAQETYDTQSENARKELRERLKSAMTGTNLGLFTWKSNSKELQENADAIADIVGSIVESNITLIAGKTGKEYEKGLDKIFSLIQDRMKAIGISESTVSKQWLSSALFSDTNIINEYIDKINNAKNAQDAYTNKIEQNYLIAKKATDATMSFTEKVDANARALRNNANDAVSLYNKIYDIVKIAQQNHVINFDLKLTAQKPPQWMLNMDLPELQRLAARFTAIAQSGGHAGGYTQETTYERGLMYASAARQKQYEEERKALEERNKANNKTKKTGGTKKDPLADSLKEEIELIDNIQKRYNEYRKIGVSTQEAIAKAAEEYNATLTRVNATLSKYGIQTKNANELANMDLRGVRDYYKSLLDVAKGANNTKGIESLEKAIAKINVEITKADYKKITDGLNSELGKIKDEYELAIELDANPELGDMFADVFNLDTSDLPRTWGDAYRQVNEEAKKQLAELKKITSATFNVDTFDLLKADFRGDEKGQWFGIDVESSVVQSLAKAQKTWRDMFQKNLIETEKMLDDYVKKYGGYSDKIAEIEADRLEKMRKLNEAYYTEQMRNTPEYKRKQQAIDTAAVKEKSQAQWDNFTNTRLYVELFENLELASTGALMAMKEKLDEVKGSMNNLKPEQLKQITAQYMKLEKELMSRNPFKGAIKHAKDYMKAVGKTGKQAQKDFITAQRNYDAQEKVVAALKEQYEQKKAQEPTNKKAIEALAQQLGLEEDKLAKLKEILNAADKEAQKYNMMTKLFKEQANEIAALLQAIGQNLQSLADLRDNLQSTFGFEFNENINGAIDGLARVGKGISGIVNSAKGGDVFGIVNGVVDVFAGLYDGIASIFGGGSASDKKITKQIQDSEQAVKRLELTYKNLEVAIDEAYGANVIGAKQAAVANKELQLAELKRQLNLERSRDSKHRDEERIIQLESQIVDLQNDIKRSAQEIATELLGISSVGDAALSFMDAYISALRRGEDAQAAFSGSWKEMIANMIKQLWVTKVIGPQLEALVDEMNERLKNRAGKLPDEIAKAKSADTTDNNSLIEALRALGMSDDQIQHLIWFNEFGQVDLSGINARLKAAYEKMLKELQKELAAATTPTIEDMDMVAQSGKDLLPLLQASDEQLNELLKRYGLYDDQSNKTLSALQQGISQISEETAGAIEAYLNGVSQQVYLHSDLLTQIRDAVVSFDMDVQLGVFSQMLLQLQQSYQVQQNIELILTGVLNPSGRAIVVELNS